MIPADAAMPSVNIMMGQRDASQEPSPFMAHTRTKIHTASMAIPISIHGSQDVWFTVAR